MLTAEINTVCLHHREKWLSLVAMCHADMRCSIYSWFSTDRQHVLAVATRDLGVARQITHTAHFDDEITLMSAGMFPRLEGGVRAALDEADSLYIFSFTAGHIN